MEFNYFYGNEAEEYLYYKFPRALILDDYFKNLSADSKLLYSLLLDRLDLSKKNNWFDKQGRIYVIYTLENIMKDLRCANQKATKIVNELIGIGLIEKIKQGLGKPDIIYVKSFQRPPEFSNHENHDVTRTITITTRSITTKSITTTETPFDTEHTNDSYIKQK